MNYIKYKYFTNQDIYTCKARIIANTNKDIIDFTKIHGEINGDKIKLAWRKFIRSPFNKVFCGKLIKQDNGTLIIGDYDFNIKFLAVFFLCISLFSIAEGLFYDFEGLPMRLVYSLSVALFFLFIIFLDRIFGKDNILKIEDFIINDLKAHRLD